MKTAEPNQENITVFTELHFEISEFMNTFGPRFSAHLIGARRQRPFCRMSVCEIMTVLIGFQTVDVRISNNIIRILHVSFTGRNFPLLFHMTDLQSHVRQLQSP